jgi:hypothetical protein
LQGVRVLQGVSGVLSQVLDHVLGALSQCLSPPDADAGCWPSLMALDGLLMPATKPHILILHRSAPSFRHEKV